METNMEEKVSEGQVCLRLFSAETQTGNFPDLVEKTCFF